MRKREFTHFPKNTTTDKGTNPAALPRNTTPQASGCRALPCGLIPFILSNDKPRIHKAVLSVKVYQEPTIVFTKNPNECMVRYSADSL